MEKGAEWGGGREVGRRVVRGAGVFGTLIFFFFFDFFFRER